MFDVVGRIPRGGGGWRSATTGAAHTAGGVDCY